jgi:hypothetical protein
MKKLISFYRVLCSFFFNPYSVFIKLKALPFFMNNLLKYSRINANNKFAVTLNKLSFKTTDRFLDSGSINHHYFHQD